MRRFLLIIFIPLICSILKAGTDTSGWRIAQRGWKYEFPRDHWSHPEFKTEWWYFTGELRTTNGRRFGYQVTFFRQGVRPPTAQATGTSRFILNDIAFGHVALTDIETGKFRFSENRNRGAFGEAGFGNPETEGGTVAWISPWKLTLDAKGNYSLNATTESDELTLQFHSSKPWIPHGRGGVSQKGEGEGHASHYYSGTRLKTEGTLRTEGENLKVTGESWFDHEWATNQLTPEQLGWNWFSLQFKDGTELMLYQMRLRNGGLDPYSSGTFVDENGQSLELVRDDYLLEPFRFWQSPNTNARYPVAWRLNIPKLGIEAEITTPISAQELVLSPIAYWEGLVDVSGIRGGKPIAGHGYMELTGYTGPLVGISAGGAPRASDR